MPAGGGPAVQQAGRHDGDYQFRKEFNRSPSSINICSAISRLNVKGRNVMNGTAKPVLRLDWPGCANRFRVAGYSPSVMLLAVCESTIA